MKSDYHYYLNKNYINKKYVLRKKIMSILACAGVFSLFAVTAIGYNSVYVERVYAEQVIPLKPGEKMFNTQTYTSDVDAEEISYQGFKVTLIPEPAVAAPIAKPKSIDSENSNDVSLPKLLATPDPGTAQSIAFKYVNDPQEFSCLVSLWNKESGWNVYAQNSSSGAYGIPQSLPGSKMASAGADWQTNPDTQIRWGLGYIQGRYGTPCAAWAHSQAKGWY